MDTQKTASQYLQRAAGLLLLLSLACQAAATLSGIQLLAPMSVSVVFHLVCSVAYIYGWKAIAMRSPETLPKYYLAGSAFRLMAAAMVLLVYCVAERNDTQAIKWFAIVFIVYYVFMLALDALFFAKVSKKQ